MKTPFSREINLSELAGTGGGVSEKWDQQAHKKENFKTSYFKIV
jgi:hypothetical protein